MRSKNWIPRVQGGILKNRLLFLLASVVAFDFFVTVLGQPAGYWHDPQMADEGNPLFRWIMLQGPICYFGFIAAYISGIVGLVNRLPRQTAIIVGLVFFLTHYFAASTWLAFHFKFNIAGPAAYALALSLAMIAIMRPSDKTTCFEIDK